MSSTSMPVILTIDDEANIRQSFRGYLEDFDYNIIEAENGKVGIEQFEEHSPDLVLVDLRMPEVDGLDVLKHISESSPETPVIVVSGTGVISDAVNALRMGAWEYLLKPVEDMEVLRHAVDKTLERAKLLQDKRAYQDHLEQEVLARTTELMEANDKLKAEVDQRSKAEQGVRESEEKLRNIIESSPLGMHVYQMDDQNRMLFIGANPAADWILKADHSMYAGQTIERMYPVLFGDEPPQQLYRVITMGETTKYQQRIDNGNDSVQVFDIHAYQATDNIMICDIADITEQVKASKERERLIEILEKKNAELERFSYTVSHDLKTPLITIRGFLGLLEESLTIQSDPVTQKCLLKIDKASENMKMLLDNLLNLSQIGRAISNIEVFNLGLLVENVKELFEYQLLEQNIEIIIDNNMPDIIGDRYRIFEVYQNLIENAIRFCRKSTDPMIEIGVNTSGNRTVFFVKDNGIGISPKYHKKVFGLFDKLDANSGGTGIGLALVKRIVDSHGGSIWVESEGDGNGTTFCFTLKAKKEVEECVPIN